MSKPTIQEIRSIRVRRQTDRAVRKFHWLDLIAIAQVGVLPKYIDRAAEICVEWEKFHRLTGKGHTPNAWHALSMATGSKCACANCDPRRPNIVPISDEEPEDLIVLV